MITAGVNFEDTTFTTPRRLGSRNSSRVLARRLPHSAREAPYCTTYDVRRVERSVGQLLSLAVHRAAAPPTSHLTASKWRWRTSDTGAGSFFGILLWNPSLVPSQLLLFARTAETSCECRSCWCRLSTRRTPAIGFAPMKALKRLSIFPIGPTKTVDVPRARARFEAPTWSVRQRCVQQ